MAETATIDLISFKSTNIDTAKSVNKSYADKSSDFANFLDSANKSYSYEKNTTQQTSSVSQKENNQQGRAIASGKELNKETDSSKSVKDIAQDSNTKIQDKSNEQISQKVEDKPEEKVKDRDTSKDTDQNNTAKNDKNELSGGEQKKSQSDNSDLKKDMNPQQEAEDMPKAVVSETAQAVSDSVLDEVQKLQNINQESNAVQNDGQSNTQGSEDIKNNESELVNQNSETENTVAQVANNIKNEVKEIVEQLKSERPTQPAQPSTDSTADQATEEQPIANATAEIDLNVAVSTENILNAVINTQVVDNQSKVAPKANEVTQPVDSTISVEVNAKNQNENIVANNNVQAKTAMINNQVPQAAVDKTILQNQEILDNQSVQQDKSVLKAMPVNAEIQQEIPDQNVKQSPAIQVATDEIASTTVKNKTGLNNIQNNVKEASLTQEVIDGTNAEIVDVKTSGKDAAANQNEAKNNQNTEDQIVKLSLEINSDNKASSTSTANIGGKVSEIMTDSLGQANFSKGVNTTQAQTAAQTVPREIKDSEILSQINGKMSSFKEEGASKVNIILRPENLGKINIELVNSKDGLTAQLTTNNAQVKEILDKNLDSLKENLGSQGINVNNVNVKVEETQKQSNDMSSFSGQMGQGQKQSSNQANQTNENNQSFGADVENQSDIGLETETDNEIRQEQTVSLKSHGGNIDYKI